MRRGRRTYSACVGRLEEMRNRFPCFPGVAVDDVGALGGSVDADDEGVGRDGDRVSGRRKEWPMDVGFADEQTKRTYPAGWSACVHVDIEGKAKRTPC
jgi:hypothetical protein